MLIEFIIVVEAGRRIPWVISVANNVCASNLNKHHRTNIIDKYNIHYYHYVVTILLSHFHKFSLFSCNTFTHCHYLTVLLLHTVTILLSHFPTLSLSCCHTFTDCHHFALTLSNTVTILLSHF